MTTKSLNANVIDGLEQIDANVRISVCKYCNLAVLLCAVMGDQNQKLCLSITSLPELNCLSDVMNIFLEDTVVHVQLLGDCQHRGWSVLHILKTCQLSASRTDPPFYSTMEIMTSVAHH